MLMKNKHGCYVRQRRNNMYISQSSAIRTILEGSVKRSSNNKAPDGGPETDMNDQIAIGSYQTKSFEMSNDAQKLYSDLPKDTPIDPAVAAAINLDKLFDLDKDVVLKRGASVEDIETAQDLAKKIRAMAKEMNLVKEHEKILVPVLKRIENNTGASEEKPKQFITPDEQIHPSDDPRYRSPSKDYMTDRTSDRDVDNVKKFLIKRSLKAQRKLKIIDD